MPARVVWLVLVEITSNLTTMRMTYKRISAALLTLVVATSIGLLGVNGAYAQDTTGTSTFATSTSGVATSSIYYTQTPGVPSTGTGGGQLTEQIMMLAAGVLAIGGSSYLAREAVLSRKR